MRRDVPSRRSTDRKRWRRRPPARRAGLLLAVLVAATTGFVPSVVAPNAAAADPTRYLPSPPDRQPDAAVVVRYAPPAEATVLRSYEPPSTRYGPGHRGVDLDVAAGTPVRAAADGEVVFAGPVAGTTWVSIAHQDGVTTSYGPIADLRVGRGHRISRGTAMGVLAAGGHGDGDVGLHWGARRGISYVDPRSLLDVGVARPSLAGWGGWRPTEHAVNPYEAWGGARWGGLGYHSSPPANRAGYAVAPNPNHLVLLPGLGSSSSTVPVDPEHLGYDLRSVTSFSYDGREPDGVVGPPDDPRRDQRPHGPEHTWVGVETAALHLRDQLRAQHAREPGRAVDLIGYSMGGVVAAHYLAHHHDAYDRTLPPIGHVVTIASPLAGSDLAALATHVRSHRLFGPLAGHTHDRLVRSDGPIGRHVGPMPLDAPAIDDLRTGSPMLDALADGWQTAVDDGAGGPLAMGTRVLTIAGGTDAVVGAGRAALPVAGEGALIEHRVLPGDHGGVLETQAVREVIWRFLAGEEVVDSPGHLSSGASHVAGHLTRYAGWRLERSDPFTLVPPGPR